MGRTKDCTDLFKNVQESHPNKRVRRQAKELLFIIEAPQLKIGEDERIKIPLMDGLDKAP